MAAYLIKIGKRPFLYGDSYGSILVVIARLLHSGNHPKSPVLLNKKLASSSLASFFIIEGKHLLHLLLTSVVSQIV